MTEFTKQKIGFALAFLAVLFTISPLVTEFGDKGVDIFSLRLIVRHLYYFTAAALALGVYSYGLQFLTQRNLRFLDSIGDAGYALAMLAPPAFLAIVVLDAAIAGLASLLPKVAPAAGVISSLLSGVVGFSSALLSRRIARSVRTLERKSESKQLGHDATALLTRAEDLRRSAMPDLALVEAYKALEVAARGGMVGRRVPYRGRPFDPIRVAFDAGLVPEVSQEQLLHVRRWRNMVVHAIEPATDERAAVAIQLARSLLTHFELSESDETAGSGRSHGRRTSMPFEYWNLDADTRRYMLEEIEAAIRDGELYFSKRFTTDGHAAWPDLLLEAARQHDEHWLAYQLEARPLLKGLENSRTPSGGYTEKHVPQTAAETMAEGQFNRYYILGLCRRAIANGIREVVIYRAKPVSDPRPESESLIGERRDPTALADEIRPVQQSLGHALLKPNSGLSVHL